MMKRENVRQPSRRRARLFHRMARHFFHMDELPLARCMNSIATLEWPGNLEINQLNVVLAERGLTSEPIRELGTEIESLCLFIGYPGSGHTVIGALLDAHPDIVIAQELNLLNMADSDLSGETLFRMIVENARTFAYSGRYWDGNRFAVEGQWQGRFRTLKVIGDKKGAGTSWRLIKDATALDRLAKKTGKPLRLIHIYRDPFDNIANMSLKFGKSIEDCTRNYFKICDAVRDAKAAGLNDMIIDLPQEDLLNNPQSSLSAICEFLGVATDADYLADCAGILFKRPRRTSEKIAWTDSQLRAIADRLEDYPWLENHAQTEQEAAAG